MVQWKYQLHFYSVKITWGWSFGSRIAMSVISVVTQKLKHSLWGSSTTRSRKNSVHPSSTLSLTLAYWIHPVKTLMLSIRLSAESEEWRVALEEFVHIPKTGHLTASLIACVSVISLTCKFDSMRNIPRATIASWERSSRTKLPLSFSVGQSLSKRSSWSKKTCKINRKHRFHIIVNNHLIFGNRVNIRKCFSQPNKSSLSNIFVQHANSYVVTLLKIIRLKKPLVHFLLFYCKTTFCTEITKLPRLAGVLWSFRL